MLGTSSGKKRRNRGTALKERRRSPLREVGVGKEKEKGLQKGGGAERDNEVGREGGGHLHLHQGERDQEKGGGDHVVECMTTHPNEPLI